MLVALSRALCTATPAAPESINESGIDENAAAHGNGVQVAQALAGRAFAAPGILASIEEAKRQRKPKEKSANGFD